MLSLANWNQVSAEELKWVIQIISSDESLGFEYIIIFQQDFNKLFDSV